MMFNFQRQLIVGNKGEELFKNNYHDGKLQKIDSKSPIGDFITEKGKIIELKTDTYPLSRTPHFFIEQYSNLDKKSPGGPWRTFLKGADLFVYLFATDSVYYQFDDLYLLVNTLDEMIKKKKLKPHRVVNTTWITTGFKIERESLSSLYTVHKIDTGEKKDGSPKEQSDTGT